MGVESAKIVIEKDKFYIELKKFPEYADSAVCIVYMDNHLILPRIEFEKLRRCLNSISEFSQI